MLISTDAVVLNSRKYSDSSKIVTYLAKEAGRLTAIAKGARSAKNKYGSALEPLSICRISYYHKQGRDMQLLSGAESTKNLKAIFESHEHMILGMALLESVNQTVNQDEKSEELFNLLVKSIILLNENIENPFSLFVYFQLQLAEILGFGLELTRDMPFMDNESDTGAVYHVSLKNGGIVNISNSYIKDTYRLGTAIINKLIRIAANNAEASAETRFGDNMKSPLAGFLSQYFGYHLDKYFAYRSLTLLSI